MKDPKHERVANTHISNVQSFLIMHLVERIDGLERVGSEASEETMIYHIDYKENTNIKMKHFDPLSAYQKATTMVKMYDIDPPSTQ